MTDFPPEVTQMIDADRAARRRVKPASPEVATPVGQTGLDIGSKPAISIATAPKHRIDQPAYQQLALNICQPDGMGGTVTRNVVFLVLVRGDAVDES